MKEFDATVVKKAMGSGLSLIRLHFILLEEDSRTTWERSLSEGKEYNVIDVKEEEWGGRPYVGRMAVAFLWALKYTEL